MSGGHQHAGMTADEALARLKEGNARFITAETNPGDCSPAKRSSLTGGQRPYAVVLSCADSRVIPEDIFCAGLGEIFVIRVAGNVVGPHELGSVEYATGHLGANLVVVIGHECCGAIAAALDGGAHGHIKSLTDAIKQGIGDEKDPRRASELNAAHVAAELRREIDDGGGRIKIISAYYELSGHVCFHEDH